MAKAVTWLVLTTLSEVAIVRVQVICDVKYRHQVDLTFCPCQKVDHHCEVSVRAGMGSDQGLSNILVNEILLILPHLEPYVPLFRQIPELSFLVLLLCSFI